MVSSSIFPLLVSIGLLGLQANAKPLLNLNDIPAAKPLRDDDLETAVAKRSLLDFDNVAPAKPILEDDLSRGALTVEQRRSIEVAMNTALEMRPVREDDLIPIHLQKRSDPLACFSLKNNVTMIYGAAAAQNQMYLANMTLHTPDPEHPLIMMEKFDELITNIECAIPQNQINIKFKSDEAMERAIASWKWVNSVEADYFYLIANRCCPTGQRKPYKVTGVKADKAGLASSLTIESIPWKQVAGNFELDLGRYDPPKSSRRPLSKRLFGLDTLALKLINFLGISPDIQYLNSIFLDLSMGSKDRIELFADPFHEDKQLQINCVGCYSTGGIELGVRVKAEDGKVKNLEILAQPKGFGAKMEVEFKVQATVAKPLSLTKSLLPDLTMPGFSIPFLFSFGPSMQFNAGFDLKFDGIGNFSTGVEVKMPDSAMIVVDMVGDKSGVSGFGETTVDPVFRINEFYGKGEAGAYVGPSIAFGAKILDTLNFEGALDFKMPFVGAELSSGYEKTGFCPDSETDKTTTTGVEAKLGANLEIWYKLGVFPGLIPIPSWVPSTERKLWGLNYPFAKLCLPLEIPGFKNGTEHSIPRETLELTGSVTDYKPRSFSAESTAEPIPITRVDIGPSYMGAQVTSAPYYMGAKATSDPYYMEAEPTPVRYFA
ncbi:hypothetical protein ABW20_dc0103062 [Dactylellina cionopaga]|nr:hypothetical protein ABW20_dc0103062 [Dactylellina cionopaga]